MTYKFRGGERVDRPWERPSYVTNDASAGIFWEETGLELFVKNPNNDRAILQQPSIHSATKHYRARPRAIGIHLTARL